MEGLELRLAGGEIVEVRAAAGADLVREDLAIDDGARRLGEVALVDASSRVGETGIVFRNTLFDENATSHIAWGAAIDSTRRRRRARDAGSTTRSPTPTSWSAAHEVEIDGIEPGGAAVALLRDARWALS